MNLVPWRKQQVEERDWSYPIQFQEWVDYVTYQGVYYPFSGMQQSLANQKEEISDDFNGLTSQAYRQNSVVFSCMETRRSHFSEAVFTFRQRRNGRPGDLFGTQDLGPLEVPQPNETTGDLLSRMIQDADLAGNYYAVRSGQYVARLRPDWTAILLGSRSNREEWVAGDPDTRVIGFMYFPGGKPRDNPPIVFAADEVAHFRPIPDPQANYLGMSWLTALIRDIQGDQLMTTHKTKYLEQGATPNLIVRIPQGVSRQNFDEIVNTIRSGHEGAANAYKTLFLAGGADATAVGSNFQEADFRSVQGAGETRIAAAARTPPVLVGLSEGLQGSSLNTGNYQSARRMFADGTMRPLWRNAAGSLAKLITVPGGAELWYDDRDIAFLKEDLKERAEVQESQARTISTLINSGFKPDDSVMATTTDDFSRLIGSHSGLTSVQLQPMDGNVNGSLNGSGGTLQALPAGGTQ